MMKKRCISSALAVLAMAAALHNPAHAQDVRLNYDRLAFIEEPMVLYTEKLTIEFSGLLDAPVVYQRNLNTGVDDVRPGFVGTFQVNAQTQLANRWQVGVAYFGQYATDAFGNFNMQDGYSDNVAAFVGTSFGTFLGGNVNGQVRELTRRRRGVGNGFLAFDNSLGRLDRWGGAYTGRFGPSVVGLAVDENADFEAGVFFQRPLGKRDLRFAGRLGTGRFTSADGTANFDSKHISGTAEMVYGSSLFDIGAGYERLEADMALVNLDRWYLSAGANTQIGALQLSGEGHYGQLGGNDEISGALGASYAFARGLSLNLGVNYENSDTNVNAIQIVDTNQLTGLASLRFAY